MAQDPRPLMNALTRKYNAGRKTKGLGGVPKFPHARLVARVLIQIFEEDVVRQFMGKATFCSIMTRAQGKTVEKFRFEGFKQGAVKEFYEPTKLDEMTFSSFVNVLKHMGFLIAGDPDCDKFSASMQTWRPGPSLLEVLNLTHAKVTAQNSEDIEQLKKENIKQEERILKLEKEVDSLKTKSLDKDKIIALLEAKIEELKKELEDGKRK